MIVHDMLHSSGKPSVVTLAVYALTYDCRVNLRYRRLFVCMFSIPIKVEVHTLPLNTATPPANRTSVLRGDRNFPTEAMLGCDLRP
jgi:hypothetical protein